MYWNKRPYNHFINGFSGQMMHEIPIDFRENQPLPYRNQPYLQQPPSQPYNWYPVQQPVPYYQQNYQPYNQNYPSGFVPQNTSFPNQSYSQKDSQFLFQNPLQPQTEVAPKPYMPMNGYQVMNPYPKNSAIPKQPGGMKTLVNSFKSQDGSVDFNKMMNTAGQMMTAVNQVSSLVKGLGGMFKV